MPREIVLINHRIELPEDGIELHEFVPLCQSIENHLKRVRLPERLRSFTVRINARLVSIDGHTNLQLRLLHDGQLPLPFSSGKRSRRPIPDLLEELQHIKETVKAALEESNQVWKLAAEIINSEEDPAEELKQFQKLTGFHAPCKPSRKRVPSPLTLIAADKQVSLFTADVRPEYIESQPLVLSLLPRMGSQGMVFKVISFYNEDSESLFMSQVKVGQDLRPRWPMKQELAWLMYAGLGVMLETPVVVVGHAIISTETLCAKSIQFKHFDVNEGLINRLMDQVRIVKDFKSNVNEQVAANSMKGT